MEPRRGARLPAAMLTLCVLVAGCTSSEDPNAHDIGQPSMSEPAAVSTQTSLTVGDTTSSGSAVSGVVSTVDGGVLEMDGASVVFAPGSVADDVDVSAQLIELKFDDLPGDSLTSVGPAIEVDLGGVEPTGPVTLSVELISEPEANVVVFGQSSNAGWEFVEGTYDPVTGLASATVEHFDWWNPFSWCFSCFFDDLAQVVGKLLGTRIDPPSCSGAPPGWVQGLNAETASSSPFVGCAESEGDLAVVRLANNRPYGVLVTSPVPFEWAAVDHPIPLNDMAHEAFGRQVFEHEDWVYIPAVSYAHIGIAAPDESLLVELEAAPNAFTAIVDALMLAIDELGGTLIDEESQARFVAGLTVECFGIPALTKPAPSSLDDVVGHVQTLGDCLADIALRESGELLGSFAISAEEVASLVLAKGFFKGLDIARFGGIVGDVFTDWFTHTTTGILPSIGLLAIPDGDTSTLWTELTIDVPCFGEMVKTVVKSNTASTVSVVSMQPYYNLNWIGVSYADVTGDGTEEAVFGTSCSLAEGGNAESRGTHVYQFTVTGPERLGQVIEAPLAQVTDTGLVTVGYEWAADDPRCCPSVVIETPWILQNGVWVEAG